MDNFFVTSDTHFGHTNIIKYCKRPFASVEEMDEEIIRRWNAIIKPEDHVFHLGDFAMTNNMDRLEGWFKRLNGIKRLVRGNHDSPHCCQLPWHLIDDYVEWSVGKKKIVMFHYPIGSWHGVARGSIHLHGHSHGSYLNDSDTCIDVGVDSWNYAPVHINAILKRAERGMQPAIILDQHAPRDEK